MDKICLKIVCEDEVVKSMDWATLASGLESLVSGGMYMGGHYVFVPVSYHV